VLGVKDCANYLGLWRSIEQNYKSKYNGNVNCNELASSCSRHSKLFKNKYAIPTRVLKSCQKSF
jgi:hypothetical protein